jgi:hypothetical protein
VNDTGYGPTRPEGRLLALRCLGLPQVAPRAPLTRRRALWSRLAACCARIRPGTTAELAWLVLRLSEEIDTRERMLDAALGSAGLGSAGLGAGSAGSLRAGGGPQGVRTDVGALERRRLAS